MKGFVAEIIDCTDWTAQYFGSEEKKYRIVIEATFESEKEAEEFRKNISETQSRLDVRGAGGLPIVYLREQK